MPFQIVRNDITKMKTQAIVNCANKHLEPVGGVSAAIFNAAGMEYLSADCKRIGKCRTGYSVITRGYALCPFIIHTIGPVWHGGMRSEKRKLISCYKTALELAYQNGIRSISFPLISAGSFGFPKQLAVETAMRTIQASPYLSEMDIYLCLFDDDAMLIGSKYHSIKSFIDSRYVDEYALKYSCQFRPIIDEETEILYESSPISKPCPPASSSPVMSPVKHIMMPLQSIDEMLNRMDESFSVSLLKIIDQKGLKDSDVYKKANIDRKLFSKIRNNPDYRPKKNTVIAFAIALELTLDETNSLLAKAGYILSHSNKADIIIEYFILSGIYDIFEINEALFSFDQCLLGV